MARWVARIFSRAAPRPRHHALGQQAAKQDRLAGHPALRRFFVVEIGQRGHQVRARVPQRHFVGAKLDAPSHLRMAPRAVVAQQLEHGAADVGHLHRCVARIELSIDQAVNQGSERLSGNPSHGGSNLKMTIDSFRYVK
ncbi:hypothetical protein ACFSTJ_18905 [Ottowia pentelensis]|uniref:hypothetical protein n=1 Tax=Ottowia pentelensis TaxID=511108 RepID=UPI003645B816